MIITVTMNPAIDKTVEIDKMEVGGLNRISKVEYDAGGKGINVSKTIKALGGESIATGFLGGNGGKTIQNVLEMQEIENDFVWVNGETRTNTKVLDQSGNVTELNEPGFVISEEKLLELMDKLSAYAKPDTLFVIAGSIPSGISKDIYERITRLVHAKGAKVLMDADGELFVKALEAGPDMIKPNRFELEQYAGLDHQATQEELIDIAKKMMSKGVEKMAVSLGSAGAMMIGKNYCYNCPGLKVKAHSTVGAGDAMVAALAYSTDQHLNTEDMIKLCIATSAGAVTTIGTKPPTRAVVDELVNHVIINKIGA